MTEAIKELESKIEEIRKYKDSEQVEFEKIRKELAEVQIRYNNMLEKLTDADASIEYLEGAVSALKKIEAGAYK